MGKPIYDNSVSKFRYSLLHKTFFPVLRGKHFHKNYKLHNVQQTIYTKHILKV